MYGVIDIGSNTIRFSCYTVKISEENKKNDIKYVFHKKNMAGLAGYVEENGELSEKGIKKLIEVLQDLKEISNGLHLENVFIFATASLRNIVNTDKVVLRAEEAIGLKIQVLSGEEEARLDFIGAMSQPCEDSGMLVDIGGGSTEIVFYQDKKIQKALSLSIGSLNMYTRHVSGLFPEKEEIKSMKNIVKKELEQIGEFILTDRFMIGVGGTNRAVCELYNDRYEKGKGNKRMSTDEVLKLLKFFKEHPKRGLKMILQVVPDRVHTMIPGLIILNTIIKHYNIDEMGISTWGVREGYLMDRLG